MKVLESLKMLVTTFRLDAINGFTHIDVPLEYLSGYLDEVASYVADLETENRELRKRRINDPQFTEFSN